MASAIAAARQQINDVGADGDLDGASAHGEIDLDVDSIADPIELPDGKLIYPPKLHGEPIDRIACALLDMQQPSRSRFLRLVGPPGTGKTQIARGDRLPAVDAARPRRSRRATASRSTATPRCRGGPSSDEFTFKLRVRPRQRAPRRRPADPRRVRRGDAARLGGDDRRGQHDPRRRAAQPQRRRSTAACRCTCPPRAAPSPPGPASRC